jgi:hypothetical protein
MDDKSLEVNNLNENMNQDQILEQEGQENSAD